MTALTVGEEWPFQWRARLNPDGTHELLEIDQELIDEFGYELEAMMDPDAWHVAIPEDELPQVQAMLNGVASGDDWSGRMRVLKQDGTERVVDITIELEPGSEGAPVTRGRLIDVTEEAWLQDQLSERETRLQTLNEQLSLILWSSDPELRITWTWGSGLALIGAEENGVVGMTLYEIFRTDDPGFEPIAAELRALTGEHVSYELELRGRFYRCTVEPHFGPMGEVLGTLGTAIDLTEQHQLEQESRSLTSAVGARRLAGEADWRSPIAETSIEVGPVRIDVEGFQVWKNGDKVDLTPTEFKLLVELASRVGRALSREVLLEEVWGHHFLGGGSLITMAVKRLRSKIEDDPAQPRLIETVRGVGYRMSVPEGR